MADEDLVVQLIGRCKAIEQLDNDTNSFITKTGVGRNNIRDRKNMILKLRFGLQNRSSNFSLSMVPDSVAQITYHTFKGLSSRI